MILEAGAKVLVVHRRLFENDTERFFVGIVDAYEHGIARVMGHTFLKDPFEALFTKKLDVRTKIFSLIAGSLMVYLLPGSTDLNQARIEIDDRGRVILTDGGNVKMDLSEREPASLRPRGHDRK